MKSFSEQTKNELFKKENYDSCCDFAEFAGMMLFGSNITLKRIRFATENEDVLERYITLADKFGVNVGVTRTSDLSARCLAVISNKDEISALVKRLDIIDSVTNSVKYRISDELIKKNCCVRAFVRGAFMGGGTVIDPKKAYNLEIITPYMGLHDEFLKLLSDSGFEFKTVVRKSKYVLYTKKSDVIEDFLSFIGAFNAQMELINIKIDKEIRNGFNRSINIENANYDKTVDASVRHVQAIGIIQEKMGLDELSPDLREIAVLRLANKSMSLQELGKLLSPPLGKSGVNHRLKRIIEISEKL